ncbi:GEVED domain-containing protein [Isoptericola sp. NPDC056134]|uniref:DUF7927 domain-containing protein n=1 Tax=Isoptericola sp. NPDC056134 TaxID=3345723 RepID=UPI0035F008EA
MSGVLAGVLALGGAFVTVALPVASAPEAAAEPGNPGVPGDPQVLYTEDFENTPDGSNILLTDYTGTQGTTYSAAAFWANRPNCNGFIVDWTSPRNANDCTDVPNAAGVYNSMLAIPHALGQLRGVPPTTNGAAASYTADSATGAQIQFQSSPITLPVANRFVTFSVDAGAMNCGVSAPLLRFYLLDDAAAEIPVSSAPINVCTDSRGTTYTGVPTPNGANQTVRAGTFAANGSTLVTGSTLAVRMRNQNSAANGNDGAYDNIQVLDVSPQLDKAFSPTSTIVGGRSTLTFTVTNTSELAAKDGWEFTDNLPAGLEVARPSAVDTDCDADVAAPAGGTTVAVTNGVLAAGEESCTVSVDVTSRTPGEYTNGPDDVEPTTGVNLPGETTVTFTPFVGAGACPTPAFLFQGSPSATPTEIDLVTGELVDQPALDGIAYNGVGYSELADAFFGMDNPTDQIYLVAPDYATVENLGSPDYSNVSFTFDQLFPNGVPIGDVSPEGILYVSSSSQTATRPWMAIDVDQESPTFLQVLDGGAVPAPAAPINAGLDWVFNPDDGRLYSFGTNANNNNVFLYAFDPANPAVGYVQVGALGALVAPDGVPAVGNQANSSPYGATYSSPGYLYGANNETGQIWRVSTTDPSTATFFAYGPGPTSNNDGARCASAPVLMDLGDAPDTYGTSLSEDGARHGLVDYDASTNTAPLMLGDANTVDPEDDGAPGTAADGDDAAGVDDEGAVAGPITMTTGVETTVTVTATNNGDEAATLAGWVDLDADGAFEAGERVTVAVPAGSGTEDYDLTFPGATVPGDAYARFRLFAGDVADPSPTGAVSGGEVEDYPVTVENEPFVCDALYSAQGGGPHAIYGVDTATGALAVEHTMDGISGTNNALGISGDGRYAFTHSGSTVYVFDSATETTQSYPAGPNFNATHGAVDRATGVYYFGNVAGSTAEVYAFDPATETYLGQVAAVALDDPPGQNGDWAFDSFGNLYLSAGDAANAIYVVSGPLPSTTQGSPLALDSRQIGTAQTGEPINGLAVDVQGYVYLGSGTTLYQVNPSSGEAVATPALSPSGQSVDLASCATPATIQVQKDVVDRRADTDQFTVSLSGGGIQDGLGNTGTTAGTDLGVQDEEGEYGGPLMALVGETYTVTETAAGTTDLANYTTAWECVNQIDDSVVASGDGTEGEFTMPPAGADGVGAAVLCTFTNDDLPVPALEITKTADPAGEVLPGGTVEYTVTVENTGETTYTADDPASFTDDLTEVLDDATWGDDAAADVGEVTYDEPELAWSGALAPGDVATITYSVTVDDPPSGDGTLSNAVVGPPESNCAPGSDDPECTADVPVRALSIAKVSSPAGEVLPGGTVTYTVTVENTGQAPYTDDEPATFTDDLTEVLDDATWDDDAAADVGEVTYAEPQLSWSGALAPGDVATITYSVTVDDPPTGDGTLTNAVVGPPESGCDEGTEDGCGTDVPVRALAVAKVSAPAGEVVAGETVTYTVTVTNTGGAPYTALDPATFTDDLTEVLDDATWNGDATADVGAVSFAEPVLSWQGALAPGDVATITYSVTVNDPVSGDGVLSNAVVGPPESGCDEGTEDGCGTDVPVRDLTIAKTSAPADQVLPGGTVTYTVTVENTGGAPYADDDPATFTDDLSEVIDDATWDGTPSADVGEVSYTEPELSWSGALAPGDVATITYSVTVNDPLTGDGTLTNAVVGPDESSCADGSDDPACGTDVPVRALQVVKSSDGTGEALPGDTVAYTITVENIGQTTYTETDPATFDDDLSDVLDDATFGDVTADVGTATFADPVLSWSGGLAPGDVATITYSVTVDDPPTGDGEMRNVVVGPEESNCTDPASEDPDCVEPNPVRALEITKAADPSAEVLPGATVTYTVTVENVGQTAYTVLDPATFTDDLADVLDDATWDGDATADVGATSYAEPVLSWSGPLAPGEVATITYSVTVDDPVSGDGVLDNAVVGPAESNCDDGTEDGCHVPVPVRALEVTKAADPSVETTAGDTVTYTVTVTNTGGAPYTDATPASFTDDLSEVLDDATWDGEAAADVGEVTYAEPELSWSGPLGPGEIATITYSVTVNDPPTGDGVLTNAVVGPEESNCDEGSDDPACGADVPVRDLTIAKSADPSGQVDAGATVAYTVTVTNTGGATYTDDEPASFTDDLTEVLDDATWDDAATADVGAVSYAEPVLSWSGALEPGEVATITYSVTVNNPVSGDGSLTNAVVGPDESNCHDGSEDPDCSTDVPVRALHLEKTSDGTAGARPGDTLTYTVTATNTGQVAYTDDDPATFDDDLTEVLDDATWDDAATADVGAVSYAEPVLTWTGPLAPGEAATITYTVTLDDPPTGDETLYNVVVGPEESNCTDLAPDPATADPDCVEPDPVKDLEILKTADPSGPVTVGDTVTYTIKVSNTGTADYTAEDPAFFTDDLTEVLDDATYDGDAVADVGDVSYAEPELSWSGALEAGETATVTYSVTVNDPLSGDGTLANAVLGPQESNCPVMMPDGGGGMSVGVRAAIPEMPEGCQVITPVRAFELSKTVDVTEATPGDLVTYTVTVTSTGTAPYTDEVPAGFSDDLTDVLDDAAPEGLPTATAGELGYTEPVLQWRGPLDVDGTVTVTYALRIDDPDEGNGTVTNVVTPDGSGGSCTSDDGCSTTTTVTPPGAAPAPQPPDAGGTTPPDFLPQTGAGWVGTLLALAALLTLVGGLLYRFRPGREG